MGEILSIEGTCLAANLTAQVTIDTSPQLTEAAGVVGVAMKIESITHSSKNSGESHPLEAAKVLFSISICVCQDFAL